MTEPITRRAVLRQAWPIMLANAAVPLLGLVDSAIIGNTGSVADLGAIALGSLVFNVVYWAFGFLRMGTTGFTAQALGAEDEAEIRATLGRALLLAVSVGGVLWALRAVLSALAFKLFGAEREVEAIAASYFEVRIWGAPATLGNFAVMGLFVGLGASRQLLLVQLLLNGSNAALDVWLAGKLGLGAYGIGLGTVIAEWTAFLFALGMVYRMLRQRHRDHEGFWPWPRIKRRAALLHMLSANTDILLRTLLLLFSFAWFTDHSARFGSVVLAANHLLLQFISLSAFFLDGYAFVTESLVGRALGARRVDRFDQAVRRSSELALLTALGLAFGIALFGGPLLASLTDLAQVRDTARIYLPLAAVYVVVASAAFQFDGIFIGATRTRAMRNASFASLAVFLLASWGLTGVAGNTGLWWSFILFAAARALTLARYYPALRRQVCA